MHYLTTKNAMTSQCETILQLELEQVGWGFHFFVANELEAYKAAYLYRNSTHGLKVEYAGGVGNWMVTVFNELGAQMKLDGARL